MENKQSQLEKLKLNMCNLLNQNELRTVFNLITAVFIEQQQKIDNLQQQIAMLSKWQIEDNKLNADARLRLR